MEPANVHVLYGDWRGGKGGTGKAGKRGYGPLHAIMEYNDEGADKRYLDPGGYFLRLANKYPDNLPDPGGKDTPAQAIRSQIFLPRWAHEPGALHALADLAPSPDLGALLKKYGDPERLTAVMKRIDMSVLELHMLWIEPYLWMEELRGKDIAASNSLNKEGTDIMGIAALLMVTEKSLGYPVVSAVNTGA